MSLNKVHLIGNLGRDAETKVTQSGTAISRFTVATTERRKSGQEWTEHTEWHRVTLFGKAAEALQAHLVKGKQVYVEGRLETRSWEKDGAKQYSTEIVAERVRLLGGGRASSSDREPAPQYGAHDGDDFPF